MERNKITTCIRCCRTVTQTRPRSGNNFVGANKSHHGCGSAASEIRPITVTISPIPPACTTGRVLHKTSLPPGFGHSGLWRTGQRQSIFHRYYLSHLGFITSRRRQSGRVRQGLQGLPPSPGTVHSRISGRRKEITGQYLSITTSKHGLRFPAAPNGMKSRAWSATGCGKVYVIGTEVTITAVSLPLRKLRTGRSVQRRAKLMQSRESFVIVMELISKIMYCAACEDLQFQIFKVARTKADVLFLAFSLMHINFNRR